MNRLKQDLYITYSNQRSRDLKTSGFFSPLDKVVTLEQLIVENFERNHFKLIIDDVLGASILYHIIQKHHIEYFTYLDSGADTLQTIYNFIVKCHRNNVRFARMIAGEKLRAVKAIDHEYQLYKQKHNLADIADIEKSVLNEWDDANFDKYKDVYIDNFTVGDICFLKSKKQEQILEKLAKYNKILKPIYTLEEFKIIKPSNVVFDAIDEMKTSLKIIRKLLEEGANEDEILMVASGINEYAPLYKLFCEEYGLKGYSSVGVPLSSFYKTNDPRVQSALQSYESQIKSLDALYGRLGLILTQATKDQIKASIIIGDEKIGIELTEPNQLVGLSKTYKHIVFMGTDISHFPPQAKDNFLYSYEDDINYFYANDYFNSSQTQLEELKRLTENLYIVTASYNGKRELVPSMLIGNDFDETIDLSLVKSLSELSLENKTVILDGNMGAYFESIQSETFSKFDGMDVEGLKATHLSVSQINKYLSCPLSYLYSNKVKVKAPTQKEIGFDVMQQGSLMHLCYELFGRKIKEDKIRSIDRKELYSLMYDISIEAYNHPDTVKNREHDENIHHQIFLLSLQAGLKDDRQVGLLAKFVDYYIEKADSLDYFQNSEFEKEFLLDENLQPYKRKDENDCNYFIWGFIDRFDNLEDYISVIDYKSKKMKSNIDKDKQKQIKELKDVQLALYILYVKAEYPEKSCYSHLLSFKGDKPYYHFANLSNEKNVKNSEVYDDEYEEKLKQVIFDTKKNIENGKFWFDNSDEEACSRCDYRFICHEGVLGKNKNLEESEI